MTRLLLRETGTKLTVSENRAWACSSWNETAWAWLRVSYGRKQSHPRTRESEIHVKAEG
jgi:hypothetical protein